MKASFYCCTRRRPELLAEAIACFIAQDWDGDKEMIIVNEEPEQKLVCECPQVKIYNLDEQVKNMSGIHNIAASLCTGDILFPTDDDDLYGPHRIRNAVEGMQDGCYKTDLFYIDTGPVSVVQGRIHCNYAFTPRIFMRSGAYERTAPVLGFEMGFLSMIDYYMAKRGLSCPRPEVPQYLYRKFTTGPFHVSNMRRDNGDDFQRGEILLQPELPDDWSKLPKVSESGIKPISEVDRTFAKGDLSMFYKGIKTGE